MNNYPVPKIGFRWSGIECWRNIELLPFVFSLQDWKCRVNGCYYQDLSGHEGLITRAEFQGIRPKKRQILFYHPINTFGLCSRHHNTELEPDKQQCLEWAIEDYGKEQVYEWLNEISKEFKVVPPFIRQILKG